MDVQPAPRAINRQLTLEPRLFALGFTQVFKRQLVNYNPAWRFTVDPNHPDQPEAHDQFYFFLASCLASIAYIDQPLALYRRHAATVSGPGQRALPILKIKLAVPFLNNIDTLVAREKSAAGRLAVLAWAEDHLEGLLLSRALLATDAYTKLETGLRLRRQMYETPQTCARFPHILAALRAGAYDTPWGSGSLALIRDLLRGLVVPLKLGHVPPA